MRIAITGPAGSGKTTLARRLALEHGLRYVELDALQWGPNWKQCSAEVLRERVATATEGDGWVTDSTYHRLLGSLVVDRADVVVWLDLPVPRVLWRLIRRSYVRHRDRVELWHGNVEPAMREQWRILIWPALKSAYANRREYAGRSDLVRLRSDAEVDAFVARPLGS